MGLQKDSAAGAGAQGQRLRSPFTPFSGWKSRECVMWGLLTRAPVLSVPGGHTRSMGFDSKKEQGSQLQQRKYVQPALSPVFQLDPENYTLLYQ